MDNTQQKTDELLDKVKDYNFNVGSLQVHAWTELRKLNPNKDFIDTHRDVIKDNKLTKLEEVQYILDIVSEINDHKSEEVENRIRDLEETKRVLEEYNKKLGTQIKFTNELLETQEKENEQLRVQLREKGLDAKEIARRLKVKQLKADKDDEIQRLTVALANAKRELEVSYRSRSPTPSKQRAEKVLTTENPTIVVHTQQEEPEDGSAERILNKVKNVLTNAKKTVNRGYTAETVNRKLADLLEYENKFKQLDPKSPQVEKDFENCLKESREALQKLVQAIPLSRPVISTATMASISTITKLVNSIVPNFFGTEGPDLASEVFRFIQGCKLAERELISVDNGSSTADVIECLKLRLMGHAYVQMAPRTFGTVDALCDAIKKSYLRRKTLDQIRELVVSCRQGVKESASQFGGRIEALLNEASSVVASEWTDEASRRTILEDFKRIAVKGFIKGLRDQALRTRFVGNEGEELKNLIEIVESAEQLFGPHMGINTVTSTTPCSFCKQEGHNRANYEKRLNTPYCVNCGVYGQEVGPSCRLNAGAKRERCGYCNIEGHKEVECRKRLGAMYCRICRTNGHTENQFCRRPHQGYFENQTRRQNTQRQANWQAANDTAFRRGGNTPRRQPNDLQERRQFVAPGPAELYRDPSHPGRGRSEPPRCYSCNAVGHLKNSCPSRMSGNSRRPSLN